MRKGYVPLCHGSMSTTEFALERDEDNRLQQSRSSGRIHVHLTIVLEPRPVAVDGQGLDEPQTDLDIGLRTA